MNKSSTTKQAKNAIVLPKKATASFFSPSKNNRRGSRMNRYIIIKTDKTNVPSIKIGTQSDSSDIAESIELITSTMPVIYNIPKNACKNGFFI